jgi:mannitol-1-phosphate 5-dehydrogenase
MEEPATAVIFGAGSVGRGFLGQLFTESGYEVVFVEIDRRVVDRLNQQGSYTLRIVDNESSQDLTIGHVRAIDGHDEQAAAQAIRAADLLATAAGVRALPQVARIVALGIARRAEAGVQMPINIIICENLKDASAALRAMVQEHLAEEHRRYLEEKAGFVEAVIARMVPILPDEVRARDPTFVAVEPYKVLPVDKRGFKGRIPDIVGLEPRENFAAYVDRKLYLHNAGHAMLGYLGYRRELAYGYEALADPHVRPLLDRALEEASRALVAEHGFDRQSLSAHVADLLARFANRPLGDTIFRLARDPLRKLGPTDRLVGGARLALKHGIEPDALSWGIAAGLAFDDPRDPQAVQLREMLRAQGVDGVLAGVCGLDPASPLADMVRKRYRQL